MNQSKFEIRQLAQKIIDKQIDFVEGCRKITTLLHQLNDTNNNLDKYLLIIKGVFSSKRSLS